MLVIEHGRDTTLPRIGSCVRSVGRTRALSQRRARSARGNSGLSDEGLQSEPKADLNDTNDTRPTSAFVGQAESLFSI
jgi:hypothetical protein